MNYKYGHVFNHAVLYLYYALFLISPSAKGCRLPAVSFVVFTLRASFAASGSPCPPSALHADCSTGGVFMALAGMCWRGRLGFPAPTTRRAAVDSNGLPLYLQWGMGRWGDHIYYAKMLCYHIYHRYRNLGLYLVSTFCRVFCF
jgi:hypothetical protein